MLCIRAISFATRNETEIKQPRRHCLARSFRRKRGVSKIRFHCIGNAARRIGGVVALPRGTKSEVVGSNEAGGSKVHRACAVGRVGEIEEPGVI